MTLEPSEIALSPTSLSPVALWKSMSRTKKHTLSWIYNLADKKNLWQKRNWQEMCQVESKLVSPEHWTYEMKFFMFFAVRECCYRPRHIGLLYILTAILLFDHVLIMPCLMINFWPNWLFWFIVVDYLVTTYLLCLLLYRSRWGLRTSTATGPATVQPCTTAAV